MSVAGRLKRFLRKEEDEARRRGVATKPPAPVAQSEPVGPTFTGPVDEVKEVAPAPLPKPVPTPTPSRHSPDGPLAEHPLMQEDRGRSKAATPNPRPVLHPVGHTPTPRSPPATAPEPAPAQGAAMPPVPYVLAPYPYPPPYLAAPYGVYPAPAPTEAEAGQKKKKTTPKQREQHPHHGHHHSHHSGRTADAARNARIIEQQRREARAAAELDKMSDDDAIEEKLLDDEISLASGIRRRRGRRGSSTGSWVADDEDHISIVASRLEAELEAAEQKQRDDDEEEQAQQLRIILEPSTESEVVSIVEVGAIACLSGRLPGVSIFYAGILFVVVALASSVLMSAAQSSYEGIPCEDNIECYVGSFCNTVTTGNGLGICTSCFLREYETTYNIFALIRDLLNSNRATDITFVGDQIQEDGYIYLCPQLVEDPSVCVERCEMGGCIEPQYLTFFSADEPATIVVAVFIVTFFALLSREQQQQTLSAFFYMRHEVKYRPLRELSKRLKQAKKRDKRFRAREDAKAAAIPHEETKAESRDAEEEEEDAAVVAARREVDEIDDIVNPIEDDFSSVSSEGTLEGKVNTYKFLCAVYSESALQVILQIAALPLMRMALFIELVSLRTAVLVSTVTILFSNATILDFLVNSLAVLFVLELDEAIFNTVNQSFPGVVSNYILVHQRNEREEYMKNVLHKRRKAARKAGIPVDSVRTDDLDNGYKATYPQIHLTAFETNLLRASCVLHAVTVFVFSMYMLILPSERCFSNGDTYLRFVWTTAIFILWGEVFFSTAIHFVYNYYDSGRNLTYLPFFFSIFTIWQLIQFLAVMLFQNYLFEELQRAYL